MDLAQLLWIQPAPVLLVDPANAGPLLDSTRSDPFITVNLVNYASAGPLVDPATAGPISESSRSWSLN